MPVFARLCFDTTNDSSSLLSEADSWKVHLGISGKSLANYIMRSDCICEDHCI